MSLTTFVDCSGTTLRKVAAQLASDMAIINTWGLDDVAVIFDFCSLDQDVEGAPCTASQRARFERGRDQMGVWFSHNLTTAYLVTDQQLPPGEPSRDQRGWPLFEELACDLFKSVVMPSHAIFPRRTCLVAVGWTCLTGLDVGTFMMFAGGLRSHLLP